MVLGPELGLISSGKAKKILAKKKRGGPPCHAPRTKATMWSAVGRATYRATRGLHGGLLRRTPRASAPMPRIR